jgi:hypothetical protein
MRYLSLVLLMVAFICLSGCAFFELFAPPPSPDVVINNVTKKQVSDALVNRMINSGWQLKTASDYNATFSKKNIDPYKIPHNSGPNYDPHPDCNANFTFVDVEGGVRVVANVEAIVNRGNGVETYDMTKEGMEWTNFLQDLKTTLEK